MKYLVMECHAGYAVVLDEGGRFLKVANLRYEVGQTVTDVVEMQPPAAAPEKKRLKPLIYSLSAVAACLLLLIATVFRPNQRVYASVYLSINPQVRIDVNRDDEVVDLSGMNEDGEVLIAGYAYKDKELDLVMEQLVDRAIDLGYLHSGGQITLTLDAEDEEWVVAHSDSLFNSLTASMNGKMSVTIRVQSDSSQGDRAVIPVGAGDSSYGDSDYGNIPIESPIIGSATVPPYSDSDYGDDDGDNDDGDDDDGDNGYGSSDDDDDGNDDDDDDDDNIIGNDDDDDIIDDDDDD
ncbi:MAG: hypothetical protein Q4C01_03480, partial [Clostridia bacterium]|nr:hypothetical protein [Clostridia bacterium]